MSEHDTAQPSARAVIQHLLSVAPGILTEDLARLTERARAMAVVEYEKEIVDGSGELPQDIEKNLQSLEELVRGKRPITEIKGEAKWVC